MIEQIFDFLSEFEWLWTGMAYFAAGTIGISGLLICVMIFVRVSESFIDFVRNHAGYISNGCKKATKRVLDTIGECIGEAVKKVITDLKSPAPEDMRPKMVGHWQDSKGNRIEIEQHDGYYILKFRECPSDHALLFESCILRYPQGWLCDDNVYYAEGARYFSLAVSDSGDEIYISEVGQTFKRYTPSYLDEIIVSDEECHKTSEEAFARVARICFDDIEDSDLSEPFKVNIIE